VRVHSLTSSAARYALAGAATILLAFGATACGAESSNLSEVAQRGKSTASSAGCASCHGANGQGGIGPSWIDLAGSDVELKVDGGGTETVVADRAYLLRSILDPSAEEVAGYELKMPSNGLTEDQAADVVSYIEELTSVPTT